MENSLESNLLQALQSRILFVLQKECTIAVVTMDSELHGSENAKRSSGTLQRFTYLKEIRTQTVDSRLNKVTVGHPKFP